MWCWRRMEISWADRRRYEVGLWHRVKEERNILHTIKRRKANWIGHVLRRNCLLKRVIDIKIEGMVQVTGWRERKRKQLLDNRKETMGCWKFKEEALDHSVENSLRKRLWTRRKTRLRQESCSKYDPGAYCCECTQYTVQGTTAYWRKVQASRVLLWTSSMYSLAKCSCEKPHQTFGFYTRRHVLIRWAATRCVKMTLFRGFRQTLNSIFQLHVAQIT
jgi:hypothetical protein